MSETSFCTYCGARLTRGAKFCTSCGARVEAGDVSAAEKQQGDVGSDAFLSEANASSTEGTQADQKPERKGFSAFRRLTLKSVPLFIIFIITALATALCAYALYRVVTDVVIPMMQPQTEIVEDSPADEEPAEETEVPVADEEEVPEEESEVQASATGDPDNFMQLAELLAMEPSEIDVYLSEEGLYRYTGGDARLEDVVSEDNAWLYGQVMGDVLRSELPAEQVDETVLPDFDKGNSLSALGWQGYFSYFSGAFATEMQFGVDACEIKNGQIVHPMTTDEIAAGGVSTSAIIPALPVNWLSESELHEAATGLFGFQGEGSYYYIQGPYMDDGQNWREAYFQAVAGYESVRGEQAIWFVYQGGVDWEEARDGIAASQTAVGCMTMSTAKKMVIDTGLYSEDEWTSADDEYKKMMFLQSYVQNVGEAAGLPNLRTGQVELVVSRDESRWVTPEEYEAETGYPPSSNAVTIPDEYITDYAR